MTYEQLREKYPTFVYEKYDMRECGGALHITYHFTMGEHSFSPCWVIPRTKTCDSLSEKLVFSLGLIELISYWKTACSPQIIVKAGKLCEKQIEFWKTLWFKGLGEFFYKNGIQTTIDHFVSVTSTGEEIAENIVPRELDGCLIPVGGGKDSVVTMELLKDFKKNSAAFIINPRGASLGCALIADYDAHLVTPKRTLDKHMLELNSQGYLNGHTPFSAMAAFAAVLSAYLNGKKYIPLSNEASANESTVIGLDVNHQYSKSFEFEKNFRDYIASYIPCGVEYFSLLRPYSEFQIARYFAKQREYFYMFKSCNVGSKTDIWCGKCPKCLFVALILSPFIPHDLMCEIFGSDLLNDGELIPTLEKLCGAAPEKPFECVGSIDEVNCAICLSISAWNGKLPTLFEHYMTLGLFEKYKDSMHRFEKFFDKNNCVPEKFAYTFEKMLEA